MSTSSDKELDEIVNCLANYYWQEDKYVHGSDFNYTKAVAKGQVEALLERRERAAVRTTLLALREKATYFLDTDMKVVSTYEIDKALGASTEGNG